MTDIGEIARQVEDLQSQVAFQEDTLRELNEVVGRQQQEILTLTRQLQLLKQRQDEQAVGQEGVPAEPPPPHY